MSAQHDQASGTGQDMGRVFIRLDSLFQIAHFSRITGRNPAAQSLETSGTGRRTHADQIETEASSFVSQLLGQRSRVFVRRIHRHENQKAKGSSDSSGKKEEKALSWLDLRLWRCAHV
jgi:hypothetical protein